MGSHQLGVTGTLTISAVVGVPEMTVLGVMKVVLPFVNVTPKISCPVLSCSV
jgi:hypothetical protein